MKRAGVLTNVSNLCCNTLSIFVLLLKTGDMECITTKLSYYITWWAGGVVRGGGGCTGAPFVTYRTPPPTYHLYVNGTECFLTHVPCKLY